MSKFISRPGDYLRVRPGDIVEVDDLRNFAQIPRPIKKVYVIGSLRNPMIPEFANFLNENGFDAFADWFAPGPEADDFLQRYAKARGWSFEKTLQSEAVKHIFEFDKHHLDEADAVVVLAPAGKSAHLELGYFIYHHNRPGYILYDEEPDRYDVMLLFATGIFFDRQKLVEALKNGL